MNDGPTVKELLDCPATPFWVKTALSAAMERDPVDAANWSRLMTDALVARSRAVSRHYGRAR